MTVEVDGNGDILGWGNGDPGFKMIERPIGGDKSNMKIKSFNGKAQILVKSNAAKRGIVTIKINGKNLSPSSIDVESR